MGRRRMSWLAGLARLAAGSDAEEKESAATLLAAHRRGWGWLAGEVGQSVAVGGKWESRDGAYCSDGRLERRTMTRGGRGGVIDPLHPCQPS